MSGLISMKFVSNKFQELENVVESEANAFTETIARQVLGYADAYCPRRTGRLASTGDVGSIPGGYAVTYGGGGVRYAAGVHARKPWLVWAYARAQGDIRTRLQLAAARAGNP